MGASEHAALRPGLGLDRGGRWAASGRMAGRSLAVKHPWVAMAVSVPAVLLLLGGALVGAQGLAPATAITGLGLGFSIAAPIGPMGVLCIRRTLLVGQRSGLMTGFAAATVEALYAGVASLGLGGLADVLAAHRLALLVFSALVLVVLGTQNLLARPSLGCSSGRRQTLWAVYASTVALALPSPLTVLPYAALCATWAATGVSGSTQSTANLVAGVFAGSMIWWALLSTSVDRLRGQLLPQGLPWINRLSGTLIIAMGGRVLLLALGV
jgi:threonine/homoserine/homoserine lactone efflux protein